MLNKIDRIESKLAEIEVMINYIPHTTKLFQFNLAETFKDKLFKLVMQEEYQLENIKKEIDDIKLTIDHLPTTDKPFKKSFNNEMDNLYRFILLEIA